MIHGGQQSMPDVSFYSMHTHGKVSKLATLNDKEVDTLFWSPKGEHIVLAGLKGSFDGKLEFFGVEKFETMNTGEYPKATVVAWDPTGRYVATAYTITPEMEKGFKNGFDLGVFLSTDPITGVQVETLLQMGLAYGPRRERNFTGNR